MGTSRSAIINGSPSGPSDNFAVRITTSTKGCTGVIVDPQIVLSAAHCIASVSFLSDKDISNCQLGTTTTQNATVIVGADTSSSQNYTSKAIYTDTSNLSCDHDVAAILLEKPITGVTPVPILLDSNVPTGAHVTLYGWGDVSKTPDAGAVVDAMALVSPTQRQKASGTIQGTQGGTFGVDGVNFMFPAGYWVTSDTVHGCFGDSGGPLMDDSGNLVGLATGAVSVEGLIEVVCGTASLTYGPVPQVNAAFIERVFQSIGKMPHRAGQPPPSDLGGKCQMDNQCNSNYCVTIGGEGVCSKPCDADATCTSTAGGTGMKCTPIDAPPGGKASTSRSVCLAPITPPTPRGCAVARGDTPTSGSFQWGLMAAAGGALLLAARRRRRVTS